MPSPAAVTPVSVAPTAQRSAEPSRFDATLRAAAEGAAGGLASAVALGAAFVPGGPVLAGAVRGALSAAPPAPAPSLAGAAGAGAGSDLAEATRALQQQAQSWNLQYLQLQESLQRESREFTAVSNVMKVRHDAAKAAIGNIH